MNAVEVAVKDALSVLQDAPSALITDVDGTISAIVEDPEQASVSARARASLQRLAGQLALVAVVTSRERTVARRMVDVDGIIYVGNYALGDEDGPGLSTGSIDAPKQRARELLAELTCLNLEDKGAGFAIHYRACPDPAATRARILELLQPLLQEGGVRVQEGKLVVELLPQGLPDKAAAVSRLLQAHAIRGAIYLGDDLSDMPVFAEMRRRRKDDKLPSWGVAVVDGESDGMVLAMADQKFFGVAEVEEFLDRLASQLQGEA